MTAPVDRWRDCIGDLAAVDAAVVEAVVVGSPLLPAQADLLIRLAAARGHRSPMNALAVSMRVSGSSLTKLVDRLSDLGYARRDAAEHDRRVVYAVLTEAGVTEATRLRARYAATLRARVLAVIGEDLRQPVDVAHALQAHPPASPG